jgi:hypothetical protein
MNGGRKMPIIGDFNAYLQFEDYDAAKNGGHITDGGGKDYDFFGLDDLWTERRDVDVVGNLRERVCAPRK